MNFMVRASYPYHKASEVAALYNKSEARPHSVRTQGLYNLFSLESGVVTYSIYEVEEGKEAEFIQWMNSVVAPYASIEGYSVQLDVVFKSARPTSRG